MTVMIALLFGLALAADPSVAQEEIGAKAIFKNPSLGLLFLSPPPGEPERPGKPPGKKPTAPQMRPQSLVPAPPPPVERRASIGIRVWVQEVDAQGAVLGNASVGKIFRSRQRIQLVVESNTDGYIAVVQEGSDGRAGLLYPIHESELLANRVPAHERVVLPNRSQCFIFDDRAGTERLLIVLAQDRRELAGLGLRREMGAADLDRLRNAVALDTGAKNLLVESLAEPGGDHSMYVVSRNGGVLVQEIALQHER
jgi:hypothetical protein